jgi:hypothetical protein
LPVTPSVTTDDGCPEIAAVSTAFIPEHARRGASAPPAQDGVRVVPFEFELSPGSAVSVRDSGRRTPLEPRSPSPLRI